MGPAAVFKVLGVPLLPLPPFVMDLRDPWFKGFEYGERNRFGTFVKTLWGQSRTNRHWPALAEYGIRKVTFRANADWYELRGPALGSALTYRGADFRGRIEGYGLTDRGENHSKETGETIVGRPRRWRYRFVHEQAFDDGWSGVVELHRLSDAGFRRAFFEQEERSGREVENRVWIQKTAPHWAFWATARLRGNTFLTETEYLPQAGLQVFSLPLPDTPFLYSSRTEVANVRRNEADPRGGRGESYRTGRLDTEHRASFPFSTGVVRWLPYAGFRETLYGAMRRDAPEAGSAAGNGANRELFLYGTSASTEFSRAWDADSDAFDLSGLAHNVVPQVSFNAVTTPTKRPADLPQFDMVDAADARQTVDFSVRHLFLTRRERKKPETPERRRDLFADVEWSAAWFPNPARDNLRTLRNGRTAAREFSNLRQEATVFPRRNVTVRSETLTNPYDRAVEVQNTGVSFRAGRIVRGQDRRGRVFFSGDLSRGAGDDLVIPDVSVAGKETEWLFADAGVGFAVEHRFRRHADERVNFILQAQITERWGLDYTITRELSPMDRLGIRRLTVHRVLHDAVFRVHYEIDSDTDERIFSFDFSTSTW